MNEEELKAAQEALSHVREMKEKFDKGVITESQFKEYSEKANATLDAQETLNQKLLGERAQEKKDFEALTERADKLEKQESEE